jgi:hypothetical protein
VNRVIRDGKVAVLYSPSFGAGWTTWNDDKFNEVLLFHPDIVDLVEKSKHEMITESFVQNLIGTNEYVCVLGAEDLRIEWLPQGTLFSIDEYDGAESVLTIDNLPFKA